MTALPPPVPPIWTTGSTEVFKTGTWRAALPRHIQAPSPCHGACPVNGDIAEWIALARQHDWRGAFDVLTRHNPFPAIAGRICHHPCETACNRAGFDEALAICKLERFVGDTAIAAGWGFAPPAAERAGHVAVVGGGPAGLSAAFQLRRHGWRVTLFEARDELGGLMRHGIPPYRLARDVLDAEIARIVALGVEVRCGEPLASSADFARLRAAHDAVFVAVGAARVKRLPVLDDDLPGVMDGAAYLEASNAGQPPSLGHHVVVIGGGSAAIDAARSARRAGHDVTIVALERREQMPAQREEIDEALEEGIALIDGAMVAAASATAPGLRLDCRRVRFEPAAAGRPFSVVPLADSGFTFVADAVLTSIGQDPDLTPFDGALSARGAPARGGRAAGHRQPRRLGRRRRRQHGPLRHPGRGHGQAGGAGHPPPAAGRGRRHRRRGRDRGRRAAGHHRHLVLPEGSRARPSRCGCPRKGTVPPWKCNWGWRSSRLSPKPSAASPAAPASIATTASSTAPTSPSSAWTAATRCSPTTARAAACACANAPRGR